MKDNQLQIISRLSAYTWRDTLFRIIIVSLVGVSFLLFASSVTNEAEIAISLRDYLRVAIVFILISESNVALDHLSEKLFPIPEKMRIRIILHFIMSLGLTFLTFLYFEQLLGYENLLAERIVRLMLALGIIFIFVLIFFALGIRILDKWIISRGEVKDLKQEKLKSDYNALQEQLNPHFLFNNLSALKSLIMYNKEVALEFVQNFTDVYRYVLQSRDKTTVKLSEELEFIESYLGIHKERLGENLVINIQISQEALQRSIPPLTLQLLVENALKHNIAAKNEPLKIDIQAQADVLCVKNNVQEKEAGFSTKSGLKNLVKRFGMLTDKKVEIHNDGINFTVNIPLL